MIDEKYVADLEKSNEDLLVALEETETNINELVGSFKKYIMDSNMNSIQLETLVQHIRDQMIEETTFHGYEIRSGIINPDTIKKMHKDTIVILHIVREGKSGHVQQINKVQQIQDLY